MIYKLSKISSEIYDENNNLVPKDTNNPVYIDFINNGGIYEEFEGTEEEKIEKLNNEETQNYLQRVNDGILLVSQFSAKLRVAKLNGVINEESHKIIDDTLIPVRTEVLAGQFKSAKYRLEEIGTAIIGQSLYDEILTELNNYISVNYVG